MEWRTFYNILHTLNFSGFFQIRVTNKWNANFVVKPRIVCQKMFSFFIRAFQEYMHFSPELKQYVLLSQNSYITDIPSKNISLQSVDDHIMTGKENPGYILL